MTFDPTDKKFQISEEFPPDKVSTWEHPVESDGWVLAHNSLRAEMKSLIEGAKSIKAPLKGWEVKCMSTAWASHHVHIHSHHTNEDAMMVPKLKERFNYPDKYEADHKTLVEKLDKIDGIVKGLKEGDEVKVLLKELTEYETMMVPHLKQEEDECLPLMRAYFTPKEIAPIVQDIIGEGPKVEVGSFIHCMTVDKFRNEFMKQEGIPGFVWYIDFRSRLALFEKEFVKQIDSLKAGEEPVEDSGWFGYCTVQ